MITSSANETVRGWFTGRLRWTPRETFESGLEKTVGWYLDNAAWWEPLRKRVYDGGRLGLAGAKTAAA